MPLTIKKYDGNKSLKNLYKKQTGTIFTKTDIIYTFYNNNVFVGYFIYSKKNNDTVRIEWIYGPGYGKKIMKIMEKLFIKNKICNIILNASVDPTENKETVMKRINFYIGLNYRIYDIIFRKKYGPLLLMKKNLCND